MKRTTYFLYPLILLSVFLFSSCNDDDDKTTVTEDAVANEWIDQTMRFWYYWADEIPARSSLNFKAKPENFFYSLLSSKDGKSTDNGHYYYSSIEKLDAVTRSSTDYGLGLKIQLWILSQNPTKYAANVLYVLPGSPADEAGIKRGNWIFSVNGTAINGTNVYDLIGTESVTVAFGDYYNTVASGYNTATLNPAAVNDHPIIYKETMQSQSTDMKVVGYMVFNHFTSGPDGNDDTTYNEDMVQTFAEFKNHGVTDFILDLRYNGGGLVTVAKLLSELLAPQSAMGQTFCQLRYNSQMAEHNYTYIYEENAANLNLNRLYVLTGTYTASASEAVINCLKPYYDVVLLGEQTEGKNVGSITLTTEKYGYEIHPIVCQIYNSQNQSDYSNGFTPDWELTGNDRLLNGDIPFGDTENDILLNVALQYVRGNSAVKATPATRDFGFAATPVILDMDKNRSNRLIVPSPSAN